MNLKNIKNAVVGRFVPFLTWLPELKDKNILRADIIAGITVAMVLIPQSMAYANLANLPPEYGLFAAFLPPMIAALFGSSRQLATGPVAVVSLMTALAIAPLTNDPVEFVTYAILLAFMVGVVQVTLGMLRLGVLVNFLSHPVVLGFTNAAAIIIATSQLGKLFGVSVEKDPHEMHFTGVWNTIVAAVQYIHWPTFFMAVLAFAIMIFTKRKNKRLPYVLLAVVITTLLSLVTGFHSERKINVTQLNDEVMRTHIANYFSNKEKVNHIDQQIKINSTEIKKLTSATLSSTAGQQKNRKTLRNLKNKHDDWQIDREKLVKINSALLNNQIKHIKFGEIDSKSKTKETASFAEDSDSLRSSFSSHGWKISGIYLNDKGKKELLLVAGGSVVGEIKAGLPSFALPQFNLGIMGTLFTMAIMISLIGFMEAISIAKAMASRTRQRLDPNQELVGQGIANISGSMFSSYPVSGSFSRSAVNIDSGAITGFSSVVTTIVVTITLLFLTPLLYHLPTATLAAVIMIAVFGLVNVSSIKHAWLANRNDGIVAVTTFALTLIYAPHLEKGIVIGVSLSLILFLLRTMTPRVVFLSRNIDGELREAKAFDLDICDNIAVLRFEGSLYFANTTYMEDMVQKAIANSPDLKYFIIDGVSINSMDATGEELLRELSRRLNGIGITLIFARFKKPILEMLENTHFISVHGRELFFRKIDLALAYAWEKLGDKHEDSCPLGNKHFKLKQEMENAKPTQESKADSNAG
ncbi:Sulfate permease [hydrothermal vent metagenome]|uniref:Sulfate permease n=1 Tax=hydrothermal vent metagenome TaxID=652676 RepID=A0A3B0Y8G3_9ZZZZ